MKWTTVSIPRTPDQGPTTPARDLGTPEGDQKLGKLDVPYGKNLFIGRSLQDEGLQGWQPATTATLLAVWDMGSPSVFFDVGANIGIYASLHARLHADATTVAFEPTPDVADAGEAMVSANGLDVRWERAAVSDEKGEATLYLSARTDASNSLVSQHREAKGTVTVPTVTLDDYVRSRSLVPAVVKIDVERHEPAVLRGSSELLATHRPIVVAELLPGRHESDEVHRLLAGHGYSARHIEPPEGQTSGRTLRDWLFWPGEIPAEFDALLRAWYSTVSRCAPAAAEPAR